MYEPLELSQGTLFSKRIRVSVTENRELSLSEIGLFRSAQLQFSLDQIDPNPIHVREIPFGWVVASSIFSLITIAAFVGGFANRDAGAWFGLLLLTGISIGCIYNTWQLSRNLFIYKNVVTGANLFAISRSSPSSRQVDQFVQKLKDRIASFRSPTGISQIELVELYKKHLHYLRSEGVLLPDEHETIEHRLDEGLSRENVFKIVR